ncbi:FAD-dependent monooxygenase [Georgenia sp. EYE_87]|uniref:NAD(P)/FAD-dependent oxidoreductase n=1 Tax=Georgenia sp. EYE_87 TaxID=2853448 RepID=UPI002005959B|nr:FAD-dependent monooxygenase [Georgenia sp. EYE_87]MCK6210718.1 FAD-dependent monooxygenase [Georgenia sp. EYE_87]
MIVVGGRVAGAATAMLLARAGMRVLCLERTRLGSDTLSTHALMRAGVLQLSRWGLLDAVAAAGVPPVHRVVFHYGGDATTVTLRPGAGVEALYAPRRTFLDALLSRTAVAAGARVEHGATVTSLLRGADGAVTGVRVRRRDGVRDEHAPLVVGADGLRSLVAAEVGAAVRWQGRAVARCTYGYVAVPAAGYEWYYDEGCGGGLIPTNDGLTCVFAASADAAAAADASADTDASADAGAATARRGARAGTPPGADPWAGTPLPPALADRVAGLPVVGRLRVTRGVPGFLRSAAGPGWALVGDAGAWKDPISTHGMTDALRDAELLARAVLAAPGPGAEQRESLAAYEMARDRLTLPILEATEPLAGFRWDLQEVQGLLRGLAAAMADEIDALLALDGAAV